MQLRLLRSSNAEYAAKHGAEPFLRHARPYQISNNRPFAFYVERIPSSARLSTTAVRATPVH